MHTQVLVMIWVLCWVFYIYYFAFSSQVKYIINSYPHLIDRKIKHAKRYVFRNTVMMSANGSDLCLFAHVYVYMCVCLCVWINCEDTSVRYNSISSLKFFIMKIWRKNDGCEHRLNPIPFLSHQQCMKVHVCKYNEY